MSWTRAFSYWLVAAGMAFAFFATSRTHDARLAPVDVRNASLATPAPGKTPLPVPGAEAGSRAEPSEPGGAGRRAPAEELPAAPATRIRISRGDAAVAWRREDDGSGWKVESPTGKAIPPGLLAAFAEQLDAVGEGERIEAAGPDADFGLDRPSLRVEWTGTGGRRADLEVGERTPTGTAWYGRCRTDGARGAVRIVGSNLVYYADLVLSAAR